MALLGENTVAQVWPLMLAHGATDAATYQHVGESVVDLETGMTTVSITEEAIRLLPSAYDREEIDNEQVLQGDQVVYFPKSLLTTPLNARDRIVYEGVTWEIVLPTEVGNGALWKIQLRRMAGATG